MRAALVTAFGEPPRCTEIPDPVPADGELIIDLLAAGMHPLVRSRAAGAHYSSSGALPLVPGVDGVGRDPEGRLRYFVLDDDFGSMAERVAIDPRRSVVLDDDADPVAVAAAMNPAMSSWVALRRRIAFEAGQSVLVLGATGSAGGMAVQLARHLGAPRVIAVGRDADRLAALPGLGATSTVRIDGTDAWPERLAEVASEVDVVLDYLWGEPAVAAMTAILTARADRSAPLSWIEIGSMAGLTAQLPAAALRAARLQLVGSGLGSVSLRDIVGELPELARVIAGGVLRVDARGVPLDEVEQAWADADGSTRLVVTP